MQKDIWPNYLNYFIAKKLKLCHQASEKLNTFYYFNIVQCKVITFTVATEHSFDWNGHRLFYWPISVMISFSHWQFTGLLVHNCYPAYFSAVPHSSLAHTSELSSEQKAARAPAPLACWESALISRKQLTKYNFENLLFSSLIPLFWMVGLALACAIITACSRCTC